jgi:hypothetical protein
MARFHLPVCFGRSVDGALIQRLAMIPSILRTFKVVSPTLGKLFLCLHRGPRLENAGDICKQRDEEGSIQGSDVEFLVMHATEFEIVAYGLIGLGIGTPCVSMIYRISAEGENANAPDAVRFARRLNGNVKTSRASS